jgi:steroid 5-alpha reductase family enzyme
MDIYAAYLLALILTVCLMSFLWAYSVFTRDASIVDRFWGVGFVIVAVALWTTSREFSWGGALVTTCVMIWGLRLSLHIHTRNRGHGEDYRYAAMRQEHGDKFWWYSFFSVFLLQAILIVLVASPVIWLRNGDRGDNLPVLLTGLFWWCSGFALEALADDQLKNFRQDPSKKGTILQTGVWSFCRHPNYFGDALQWWGVGVMAASTSQSAKEVVIIATGPLIMTWLLRNISGVALLEKAMVKRPGYDSYVKNVPPFLPRRKFWIYFLTVSFLLYLGSDMSQSGGLTP